MFVCSFLSVTLLHHSLEFARVLHLHPHNDDRHSVSLVLPSGLTLLKI